MTDRARHTKDGSRRGAKPRTHSASSSQDSPSTLQHAKTVAEVDKALGAAFAKVQEAIEKHGPALMQRPGVLSVRPGFRFRKGWITDEPAIVVTVLRKTGTVTPDAKLPARIGGFRVDVRSATPEEQLRASDKGSRKGAGSRSRGTRGVGAEPIDPEQDLALPGYELAAGGERGIAPSPPARKIGYVPPPRARLDAVEGPMTVLCHTSPDAGFPSLRAFLGRVKHRLTIGMYDFTAPHVLAALRGAMTAADGDLTLVLDPKVALPQPGSAGSGAAKAKDIPESQVRAELKKALGNRFHFAWAAVRDDKTTGALFSDAYHIKVAVADGQSMWLSSGNWQSTNQPDLDPIASGGGAGVLRTYNREWNVVVDSPALAKLYEKFLLWDHDQALPFQAKPTASREIAFLVPEPAAPRKKLVPEWFRPLQKRFTREAPLRVQPLLTPDNYAERVLEVIEGAKRSLRLQNQYIRISKQTEELFEALLDALLKKQSKKGFDLRIILRDLPGSAPMLEALRARGFDPSRIKLQPGCHTKGILADAGPPGSAPPKEAVVVIGSHNYSSPGVTKNRDASLIFHDPDIARFYRDVFDWDWENLAQQKVSAESALGGESGMPRVLTGKETDEDKTGRRVVPLSIFDD